MKSGTAILIIIIITTLLLVSIISISYIVYVESNKYFEDKINSAYTNGTNDGINYWNNQVIQSVNSEGKIPFIVNNTVQTISVEQMCGSEK